METIEQREGSTRYYLKADANSAFILSRSCYEPMLEAWLKGAAFFHAIDKFGDPVVIKLADIHMIGLCSPEGITKFAADLEIEREQKKANEMID